MHAMKTPVRSLFASSRGFSLIELLVYMAVLVVLLGFVTVSFIATLERSVQQTGIAETEVESHVGIEVLRADLEHAGFGLPWNWDIAPDPYTEPATLPDVPDVPRALNGLDVSPIVPPATFPPLAPRPDYLVVRSTNVARGPSSQTWGYVGRDSNHQVSIQSMGLDAFANNDQVIVVRPMVNPSTVRRLVTVGANNNYVRNPTTGSLANHSPPQTPNDPDGERYLLYGLRDSAGLVQRPFNRADYYINYANVPLHCNANTGVLVKAQVNQANNNYDIQPFIDCVADFQVVFYLDNDGDGGWETRGNASSLNGLTAEQVRDRVKFIRAYILFHEGGEDRNYTYPTNLINVGEVDGAGNLLAGRQTDLAVTITGNWARFRWKVADIAITPKNLK